MNRSTYYTGSIIILSQQIYQNQIIETEKKKKEKKNTHYEAETE
jgi:hypothetical protein